MTIIQLLNTAIDRNTFLFLILSAFAGVGIKFIFDKYLAHWIEEKRKIRAIVKKYKKPLLVSAQSLERGINNNIRNFDERWIQDVEYFKLNTLYRFGNFLAWLQILEKETGFIEFSKAKDTDEFYSYIRRIYGAFTSLKYFLDYYDLNEIKGTQIQKGVRDAIGEIMVKRENNELIPIGFAEFVQNYKADKDKFFWMDNLENFLILAYENEIVHDRLILIEHYLQRFIWFLDEKKHRIKVDRRFYVNLEKIKNSRILTDLFNKLKSRQLDGYFKKEDLEIIKDRISKIQTQP